MPAAISVPLSSYHDVLWTIEGSIDGPVDGPVRKCPGRFLFDTGAGITALTPRAAKAAGLTPFGRMTGFRMSGERVDMARVDGVALTLGGRSFHHNVVGVFDLMRLLPPDWEGVAGVVSLSTFERQPFTIDLDRHRLQLESAASLRERVADMTPLRVRESRTMQGMALDLFVAVTTERGEIWLELDSGNAGPVVLGTHVAKELGWPAEKPTSRAFELAGFGPFTSEVVVSDIIYDGNFGATFFRGRRLTFDLEHGRLWSSQV